MNLIKLLNKIENRSYKVGIIGLGYVGLPLLQTIHEKGLPVIGFDIDKKKLDCLESGKSYINHISDELIDNLMNSNRCDFTLDFSRLMEVDAVLMCVPTPLNKHREPDMSYVLETTKVVANNLKKAQLIILESTTYPGTTEEIIIPILEKVTKLKAGKDFYVAYSPEREDPGNPQFNTSKIPKVVGGYSQDCLTLAKALYDLSIIETVTVSDTKTAEAVKITENVFRSVNIALVNELKVIYSKMGIDVHEVLEAADTKPFGFMKFTPGPGLGGHCIPIDPFYLTWKAREFDETSRFIELAGEINTNMPDYVIEQTIKALNIHKKAVNGSKILLVGLAYKPNVDDMRESPTFRLFDILEELGGHVEYYDNYIPTIPPTKEYTKYTGKQSIEWTQEIIKQFDAVLISTNHSNINYNQLAMWSDCIIDTRNAMKEIIPRNSTHIFKA